MVIGMCGCNMTLLDCLMLQLGLSVYAEDIGMVIFFARLTPISQG
jgi:hypothetical protein